MKTLTTSWATSSRRITCTGSMFAGDAIGSPRVGISGLIIRHLQSLSGGLRRRVLVSRSAVRIAEMMVTWKPEQGGLGEYYGAVYTLLTQPSRAGRRRYGADRRREWHTRGGSTIARCAFDRIPNARACGPCRHW